MAGRLPGLVAGQVDGVALHPEDVYLAKQQKPTLNILLQLADLMPNYQFNSYGASAEWIARDRALLRDTVAAMIEANRAIYGAERCTADPGPPQTPLLLRSRVCSAPLRAKRRSVLHCARETRRLHRTYSAVNRPS